MLEALFVSGEVITLGIGAGEKTFRWIIRHCCAYPQDLNLSDSARYSEVFEPNLSVSSQYEAGTEVRNQPTSNHSNQQLRFVRGKLATYANHTKLFDWLEISRKCKGGGTFG